MIVEHDTGPARLALLIAVCLILATAGAGYALFEAAAWLIERR